MQVQTSKLGRDGEKRKRKEVEQMKAIGHEEKHAHLNLLQFVQQKARPGERERVFFLQFCDVAEVISIDKMI